MLGNEKGPSGIDRCEEGEANRVEEGLTGYLRIGVVERSPILIDEYSDGGVSAITWSESSAKVRNRKPASDLIEYLLEEVLGINNTHKSELIGWHKYGDEICPLTVFKIAPGVVDRIHRARMIELMACVPEMLTSAEFPDGNLPWLSPVVRERVLKKLDEVLITWGDRAMTAPIDITVNNAVVGTLSGTYGPKPKMENLDPKAETFFGRVTNTYTEPPGFQIRETESKKGRLIHSDMATLDFDQLNAWRRDKQIISVDVQTTIRSSGKPNHELVKVQVAQH